MTETAVSEALSASLEDYLEAIFNLLADRPAVRANEVARRLRVSGPSVTVALGRLAARGLIRHAPYASVKLTAAGRARARRIARRHTMLRDFFIEELGAERAEAERCACRIEHVITPGLFDRWVRYVEARRRRRRAPRGKRKGDDA